VPLGVRYSPPPHALAGWPFQRVSWPLRSVGAAFCHLGVPGGDPSPLSRGGHPKLSNNPARPPPASIIEPGQDGKVSRAGPYVGPPAVRAGLPARGGPPLRPSVEPPRPRQPPWKPRQDPKGLSDGPRAIHTPVEALASKN